MNLKTERANVMEQFGGRPERVVGIVRKRRWGRSGRRRAVGALRDPNDFRRCSRAEGWDSTRSLVLLPGKKHRSQRLEVDADVQELKSLQSAYVTTGAVSQECLRMPNYCNRCSTRMSPLPYLQTPGNKWAARCGHVAQLKDPQNFDQDMLKVQDAEKIYVCAL